MRELTVKIQFTQPCLGNTKTFRTVSREGKRKKRPFFLFQRSPVDQRVMFMQTWWQAVLIKAAEVQCRLQREVKEVKFSLEVDGQPRRIPDESFKRYHKRDQFSPHEQFAAGDVIGVSCLVPSSISDDDFWSLLDTAGQYFGISPFRPGEYGFFRVTNMERRRHASGEPDAPEEVETAETK